ncbi:DUF4350 domain-containing protein [Nonomuraea sp. B12E4]|uniref:DUF4350 domain-containing protein n=1 Tax=Nonomuraea sp. B12E4 TaxID=3153564 RepID=UPI00325ED7F9
MSVTAPPAPPPPAESRSTSPTARSVWRAWRMVALVGVVTVLVSVIALLVGPDRGPSRPLDPDDTTLAGSKALAELLRARGVTVDRVDSVRDAADLAATGDRLLLITDMMYFDEFSLSRIPGDRLIVGNVFGLEVLAPGVRTRPGQVRARSREPECSLPAAVAAGSAYMGGFAFHGPSGTTGCYRFGGGSTLISFPDSGRTITVVGDGSFMSNQRLAEDGNAALAINLLDTGRPVTWLVRPDNPPRRDLTAGESRRSIYDLMPAGIVWALFMSVIALALTAFWRGRRLGPVVTEKLPVIVRAAETVEGRGRLYRARRARQRAADSLRAGTIDRLTPRLGLGSGAGAHEVVAALAARTGQDPQQIGAALYGSPPADDAGLVGLAGYLDFIERQVSEL